MLMQLRFELVVTLLSDVVVHSTSFSRIVFDQIYTLCVAIVERFTAISVIFTVSIAEFFLFSFGCRKFCRVPLTPLCSSILEPNLEEKIEKSLKINHKKSQRVLTVNHKTNRLIGRLFEMVYLAFFTATSYGVKN